MAMAPSNNPMRADEGELWGEEPIVTSSASAPALHETPRYVRRDPSRDREREEGFKDHPRSWSTEKRDKSHRSETQPLPSTRSYFGEDPSMVSVRTCKKDTSDETEEVKKLFQTLGHLSISDAAFALQPFTGSSHCGDQAEKWLEQFSRYVAFKKLNEDDQLQLFHLLMKDQAADWLTSLPRFRKDDIHVLKDEFMKRHQMTRVEKWKQTADIWRRRQGPTEPVDDYIAAMQTAARRVKMSQSSLADAIIQGLRPEIRLHVLHAGSETLEQILEAARISEAAHSANIGQATSTDKLAVKVEQLLDRLTAQTTTTSDPILQPKKVTFTQSAVTETSSRGHIRERSASPSSRTQSPDDGRRCDYDNRQSSSRSSAWQTNSARQPTRGPMDGGRFDRRELDNRRFTSPTPRQATTWRPPTSSHQMMRRLQRETLDHDLVRQLHSKPHISIRFISVCLVTVIFVVIHIHQAVSFVRPLILNVLTVQKWVIWQKCVVVDQQLQAILRIVNTRDSHPEALRVRVRSEQFNRTKTFWLYRLI
jgi:hypothetical protein